MCIYHASCQPTRSLVRVLVVSVILAHRASPSKSTSTTTNANPLHYPPHSLSCHTRYNGMLDCIYKIAKTEGGAAVFKGTVPALFRQTIYTSIVMVRVTRTPPPPSRSAASWTSLHPAGGSTNTCCSFLHCSRCTVFQSFV